MLYRKFFRLKKIISLNLLNIIFRPTDPKFQDRLTSYYIYTHTRCPIWLIGMGFGYILHRTKDMDVKIRWYYQILGWILTAAILYGVTMAPYYSVHGFAMSTNIAEGASYEAFSKIGWGLMLSWIVFSCYHGYGGVVNSFLSNPLWQPLARLSFTMYLSHLLVISVIQHNTQTSQYFSHFALVSF